MLNLLFDKIRFFVTDRLFVVGVLLALQFAYQTGYFYMGVYVSEYFTWGPNDRLFFIKTPIDTWQKWMYLMFSRVIGTLSEAALADVVQPWIVTTLQDEQKVYLPYRKWKCRLIVQLYYTYHWINEVFSLFLMLTQFDIALVEIVCKSFVLQFWTLPHWLRKKEFTEPNRAVEKLFKTTS